MQKLLTAVLSATLLIMTSTVFGQTGAKPARKVKPAAVPTKKDTANTAPKRDTAKPVVILTDADRSDSIVKLITFADTSISELERLTRENKAKNLILLMSDKEQLIALRSTLENGRYQIRLYIYETVLPHAGMFDRKSLKKSFDNDTLNNIESFSFVVQKSTGLNLNLSRRKVLTFTSVIETIIRQLDLLSKEKGTTTKQIEERRGKK